MEQCSVISKPLTVLTGGHKRKILTWTTEMKEAFNTHIDKLVTEVILSFPDYSNSADKLELYVDASGIGVGGCLVQKQLGQYKTIAYSSMTFSDRQRM